VASSVLKCTVGFVHFLQNFPNSGTPILRTTGDHTLGAHHVGIQP